MRHYIAKTDREDVLLDFIDKIYRDKCDAINSLGPSDCGLSGGEIEEGISITHSRVLKSLDQCESIPSHRADMGLLPCKSCGKAPGIRLLQRWENPSSDDYWEVSCYHGHSVVIIKAVTKDDAVKMWNSFHSLR